MKKKVSFEKLPVTFNFLKKSTSIPCLIKSNSINFNVHKRRSSLENICSNSGSTQSKMIKTLLNKIRIENRNLKNEYLKNSVENFQLSKNLTNNPNKVLNKISNQNSNNLPILKKPRNNFLAVFSPNSKSTQTNTKMSMHKSSRRNRQVTYKLGFIMFTFLFSWFPFCLLWPLMSICSECVNPTLYVFSFWLAYSNSIFTPLILLCNNSKYKRWFATIGKFIFCGIFTKKSTAVKSSVFVSNIDQKSFNTPKSKNNA